jgi:hypothetical protein
LDEYALYNFLPVLFFACFNFWISRRALMLNETRGKTDETQHKPPASLESVARKLSNAHE